VGHRRVRPQRYVLLARDCARDKVVRKFVAPALELIMLDKALRGEFDREEALLIFGEMYATAWRETARGA
jgi:hypothetical protein